MTNREKTIFSHEAEKLKQTRLFVIRLLILTMVLVLAGCASTLPAPRNKENLGAIFNEYPQWYKAAKKCERKWGVPVNVQMAIIYYESAFKGDARPPCKKFCGIPTWEHISSAYGYAQALDGTWEDYLSCCSPWFAKRNKFESATDFIGWYSSQARQRLGISSDDSYNLYLAYHEGLAGYQRQSYLKKPWLMNYARKVAVKSVLFQNQLAYLENPYDYCPMSVSVPAPMSMPIPVPSPQENSQTQELDLPAIMTCNSNEEKDPEMNM